MYTKLIHKITLTSQLWVYERVNEHNFEKSVIIKNPT